MKRKLLVIEFFALLSWDYKSSLRCSQSLVLFIFFLSFLLQPQLLSAQVDYPEWRWAKQAGGPSSDYASAVATGSSGTVYTAGAFSGTAAFGSTSLTSRGAEDAYIAHYTADGDLLWAHQVGGPAAERATAIVTDGSGNLYIAGVFSGNADFSGTSLTSSGAEDAFLAKYDATGALLWVRQEGGERIDSVLELSLDIAENVHLAVRFERSSSDEPLEQQVYIYKYGSSGNLQWSSSAGGEGGNVTDVSFDAGGNTYVTGDFTGTMVIGDHTFQSPTNPYVNYTAIFTAKFNPEGEVTWAREAYGLEKYSQEGFPASVNSPQIATDKAGNIYIFGIFYSGVQFDDIVLDDGFEFHNPNIPAKIFLAKYDNAGNPAWAKRVDKSLNGGVDIVDLLPDADDNLYLAYHPRGFMAQDPTANVNKYDTDGNLIWKILEDADYDNPTPIHQIAVDEDSRLYMAFSFIGKVYIVGTTGTEETSALITSDDLSNRFTAIYSAEGAPVWVQQVETNAVADAPDGVYMAGSFENTATFGTDTLTSNGDTDAYLAKVAFSTFANPYCVPSMASGCADDSFIGYFRFAGIYYNFAGIYYNEDGQGCENDNSYTSFVPFFDYFNDSNYTTTVAQGQSYPISFRSESSWGHMAQDQAYGIWIDYNDDKDFDDSGEFVYSSPEVGAEFSGTVTIPADISSGVRRLRVRSRPGGVFTAGEACAAGNYGEIQDYTFAIGYCTSFAPGSCLSGTYINNFSFNALVNNDSGCNRNMGGYISYEPAGPLTTTVKKGESYSISVQSGPEAQTFGVWIDYNNDRDFYDEGEFVYGSPIVDEELGHDGPGGFISPSASTDMFEGMVTIPAHAITGAVRMRVRSNIFDFYGYEACAEFFPDDPTEYEDSFFYGETEDYTITIEDAVLPPQIASFSPIKGLTGTTVTLRGAHLLTTSSVSFSGTEAAFTVVNENVLEAVVPADATTGRITITTDGGEAISESDFRVLRPSIFVFAPWRGYEGSKVLIVGEHLASASEVRFNGVPATGLKVYNDHLLKVTVPEGATTGRITVLLAGGGQVVSSYSYVIMQGAKNAKKETELLAATSTETIIAYPNPFTEGVTVSVRLEAEEPVSLVIYSSSGQKVRELNFGRLGAGQHELRWDGTDSQGRRISRGLYLYKVVGAGKTASGKLLKER